MVEDVGNDHIFGAVRLIIRGFGVLATLEW